VISPRFSAIGLRKVPIDVRRDVAANVRAYRSHDLPDGIVVG
jgi:hypothetical protein